MAAMNKASPRLHPLLQRMGGIKRMERGTLCRMSGRPHYNHQTWHKGRNVVRYVPIEEVAALQKAMDGYRLFKSLAERYAEVVIQRTRCRRDKCRTRNRPSKSKKSTSHNPPARNRKDV